MSDPLCGRVWIPAPIWIQPITEFRLPKIIKGEIVPAESQIEESK